VVALPPSPAPPHGQDGVSVHSGSRERERRCGDSGGGLRHLGRGRQPPLVLKPETTRSGLIYKERRGEGRERRETGSTEGERGEGFGECGVAQNKNIDACQRNKKGAVAMSELELIGCGQAVGGVAADEEPHSGGKKHLNINNRTEY